MNCLDLFNYEHTLFDGYSKVSREVYSQFVYNISIACGCDTKAEATATLGDGSSVPLSEDMIQAWLYDGDAGSSDVEFGYMLNKNKIDSWEKTFCNEQGLYNEDFVDLLNDLTTTFLTEEFVSSSGTVFDKSMLHMVGGNLGFNDFEFCDTVYCSYKGLIQKDK